MEHTDKENVLLTFGNVTQNYWHSTCTMCENASNITPQTQKSYMKRVNDKNFLQPSIIYIIIRNAHLRILNRIKDVKNIQIQADKCSLEDSHTKLKYQ